MRTDRKARFCKALTRTLDLFLSVTEAIIRFKWMSDVTKFCNKDLSGIEFWA
jgi:hypothetical protein